MQDKYRDFSKRKKEATPLKEAFEDLLKAYRLKDTYEEKHLIQSWPELMGNTVASRTSSLYIKDKKLFVKISSGPIKKELSMNRTKVLGIIHEKFGPKIIEEIIFL